MIFFALGDSLARLSEQRGEQPGASWLNDHDPETSRNLLRLIEGCLFPFAPLGGDSVSFVRKLLKLKMFPRYAIRRVQSGLVFLDAKVDFSSAAEGDKLPPVTPHPHLSSTGTWNSRNGNEKFVSELLLEITPKPIQTEIREKIIAMLRSELVHDRIEFYGSAVNGFEIHGSDAGRGGLFFFLPGRGVAVV